MAILGEDKSGALLLKGMLVLAVVLLGIQIQFQDATASAYFSLAVLTFIGYIGSRVGGLGRIFVWQGFGSSKALPTAVGVGVVLYVGVAVLGALGLPLAIGGGVVLNVLYRVISAVIFEEGAFRSFLYPTFKQWFGGNALAGAAASSIGWSYFHIVALGGSVASVVSIFFIGFAFALANEYCKSAMPSYVAHFIWNFRKVVGV